MTLPTIIERKRFASPAPAPQALAFFRGNLWMGSRDVRRLYQLDPKSGDVLSEHECPGIPWAAVATRDVLRFTMGFGADDDRFIMEFDEEFPDGNSDEEGRDGLPGKFACPEFTGSYLSWDGDKLYLSQWYMHRLLEVGAGGSFGRSIDVADEVSGHTVANRKIYVLRGTEENGENWRMASFDPSEE